MLLEATGVGVSVPVAIEQVPAEKRTRRWLSWVVPFLEKEARLHGFMVSAEAIERKLIEAPRLAVVFAGSEPAGFLAATDPLPLVQTGLWAVYIPGVIIAQRLSGLGLVARLLEEVAGPADLFILNTQNLTMARSLWRGRAAGFPHGDWQARLTPSFEQDLRGLMAQIKRRTGFDSLTGVVPDDYKGHRLYSVWNLPGNAGHKSFENLGQECSVLCLAFNSPGAAAAGLASCGGVS